MATQTVWAVAIVAVIAAALIGFFLGRVSAGGARQRLEELEADARRQNDEIAGYKREVDAHFDKTATLFVSMAGSYKDLFEHLSSGYEKLSEGSSRDLFKDRVTALLLEEPGKSGSSSYVHEGQEGGADTSAEELAAATAHEPASPEPVSNAAPSGGIEATETAPSKTPDGLPPEPALPGSEAEATSTAEPAVADVERATGQPDAGGDDVGGEVRAVAGDSDVTVKLGGSGTEAPRAGTESAAEGTIPAGTADADDKPAAVGKASERKS